MGLFGFAKSQLLKVIEWTDNTKDTLVYKVPMEGQKIMMGSRLTVRESQTAVFVNKGKLADIFEPGVYRLKTSNLPLLTAIFSWPYGFKSPFFADVYYVNTKQFTNIKWGTLNPITMRDKEFGTIRIRSYGSMAFKVSNPEIFLKELFGTNSTFKTEDISSYLKSMLIANISDAIAESKISALDLACNLLEFNTIIKDKINVEFNKLGLSLTNLVIENISFPEEVEKAIDTRTSMGVMGDTMDTFVKFQAAHALRDSANNQSSGNMATMGVGFGAGNTMANMLSDGLKPKQNKKVCPECGSEQAERAKFCHDCGFKFETLKKTNCVHCNAEINAKAKFCPECGKSQKAVKLCKKCNAENKANAKFCIDCGSKL